MQLLARLTAFPRPRRTQARLCLCGEQLWVSSGKQLWGVELTSERSERVVACKPRGLVTDIAHWERHVVSSSR